MSSFRLLETGDEPLIKVGDHVKFVGNQWDESLAGKTFKVIKSQPTVFRYDLGIFGTSSPNDRYSWTVDDIIRPDHRNVLFEIRLRIIGSAVLYVKYPNGRIRGGLEKGVYSTPDPDLTETRNLGIYTESELENRRLLVFEAYTHGPDFEIRNFFNDSKVIIDMLINELELVAAPSWGGPVIEIQDDKVMRW